MSAELVILVPVLGRPHRVRPLLESARAATPDARILFIPDPGDAAERAAIAEAGAEELVVSGNYAGKINAGVAHTSEPLIFIGADDLHFHQGWLEDARELLDDRIGVVGTRDLCNPRTETGQHSTHSLVARWYAELGTVDEPGKVLHDGYPHEFVDDEFIATARSRDAYAHAHGAVVEHLHPQVGKAPMDDLYAMQRQRMRAGRRLFEQRRALWAVPLDVSVAIGTFGDHDWIKLAETRAIPSARAEGVPVVHAHGKTIAEARNAALADVRTEWVVHLDADDELEPGFMRAMASGHADVRAPMVKYVRAGTHSLWQPRVAGHRHDCDASCLRAGNWVVIGACVRTELLRRVGWHDFPWSEDWATWALCAKAGASFELIRSAIYVAHVRQDSRNRGAAQEERLAAHRAIEQFVWPEEAAAA